MHLVSVTLKHFRGYRSPTRIVFSDLTAIVGKNDSGKSTILEALEIFFNNETIKVEHQDWCKGATENYIEISCEFEEIPELVLIDNQRATSLKEEFLLNERGLLEIVKVYDCSLATLKEKVYARALHPCAPKAKDLLEKKITELKALAAELGTQADDNRSSASLRDAIRGAVGELDLREVLVPLDKEDAKNAWARLKEQLPSFALFQSDRPSKDDDPEVQNPMKSAIAEAIKLVEPELAAIKQKVEEHAIEVAERTLAKLKELDSSLASKLKPNFKSEPNYGGGFKLTLSGDDDIPINKRGSGVRRLILLSFFRAESDLRHQRRGAPNVIYAVEEPESSQHPSYQKMLVSALVDLSEQPNTQLILTTHVPGVAALLPQGSLRLVKDSGGAPVVLEAEEDTLKEIADELGVLPDDRVRVLLFVEGPHDVAFLDGMARVLQSSRPEIPIPSNDPRIGIVITGGGNLAHWVNNRYLRNLQRHEVHIYDRDDKANPKYQKQIEEVQAHGEFAVLTNKREAENYLHPDAIEEALGHRLAHTEWDWADVPELLAKAVHEAAPDAKNWVELSEEAKEKKCSRAKKRLNTEAVGKMNLDRLAEMDPKKEIEGWFNILLSYIQTESRPITSGVVDLPIVDQAVVSTVELKQAS